MGRETEKEKQCVIIPDGLSASVKHRECLSTPQQSHHQTKQWRCEAAAENTDNKLFGFVMNNFQTPFITSSQTQTKRAVRVCSSISPVFCAIPPNKVLLFGPQ